MVAMGLLQPLWHLHACTVIPVAAVPHTPAPWPAEVGAGLGGSSGRNGCSKSTSSRCVQVQGVRLAACRGVLSVTPSWHADKDAVGVQEQQ